MEIEKTEIEGCFVITPKVFTDERGQFYESFHNEKFKNATGLDVSFVQDNISISTKNVIRGLHFQKGEFAQAKLVQAIKGKVLDVLVDIRKESPTFGKHLKFTLSEENRKQVFVPKGIAHGFVVLSDEAVFSYKCDAYYQPSSEAGIFYADEQLEIDWQIDMKDAIISPKDQELPTLKSYFDAIGIVDRG